VANPGQDLQEQAGMTDRNVCFQSSKSLNLKQMLWNQFPQPGQLDLNIGGIKALPFTEGAFI
jgi:hypothetical protein